MCKRWLYLLLYLFLISANWACRKDKITAQERIPRIPGIDTTLVTPGTQPVSTNYIQVPVHVPIGKNVGGYYQALPPSYDSADNKYPLLIFLHGGGELGDGSAAELPRVLKIAVPKRIEQKTLPTQFIVGGLSFSFIIISPQFKKWPANEDIESVIEYLLPRYRIDTNRIYLSGLSMGGGATWEFAGSEFGYRLAAIVPICGASWADSATARNIANHKIASWAFHNEDDKAVNISSTKRYARLIDAANPVYPVKMTIWPTGGHDAWTKATDPEYREDGKNMYEWMLQFVR